VKTETASSPKNAEKITAPPSSLIAFLAWPSASHLRAAQARPYEFDFSRGDVDGAALFSGRFSRSTRTDLCFGPRTRGTSELKTTAEVRGCRPELPSCPRLAGYFLVFGVTSAS